MLHLDLKSDLKQIWVKELTEFGYLINNNDSVFDVGMCYLNLKRRMISAVPRKVYKSKELSFDNRFASAILEIERKARKGESLKPYLSKTIVSPTFNDRLLLDWGIHHLHLGSVLEKNGFVERTEPVLFVWVTDDSLYMIAVKPHGGGVPVQPWADRDLLEIVLTNWEHLLPAGSDGWLEFDSVSASDHLALREAKVNVLIGLSNGKVYCPIGGGMNNAGSSINDTFNLDWILQELEDVELYIKANLESQSYNPFRPSLESKAAPIFRLLSIRDGQITVGELHSKCQMQFPI